MNIFKLLRQIDSKVSKNQQFKSQKLGQLLPFSGGVLISCLLQAAIAPSAQATTLTFSSTPSKITTGSGTDISATSSGTLANTYKVGDVYRFANVASGIDALVTINAVSGGAKLKNLDDNASLPTRLQPTIVQNSTSASQGHIRFDIQLVLSGLSTPVVATNVYFSAQDVDGNGAANSIREFVEVIGATTSYVANPTTLQSMTTLPVAGGVAYEQINSSNVQDGIGTNDQYEFYSYLGASVGNFSIVGGNIVGTAGCASGNIGCDRLNSWTFNVTDVQKLDWGDAPSNYGDAYHPVPQSPTVYLGASVEGDDGPNYTASANGDDTTGIDDEDGVTAFPTLLTNSTSYSLNVTCVGTNVPISGWIDFNRNGSFSNTTEKASGTCNGSTATLNWTSLSGLSAGNVYARFRTASIASEVINPTGQASNGEVEDYQFPITQASDYGDAPSSFGDASHNIPTTPTIYLGSVKPDPELATQLGTDSGASAAGDDNNGTPDDEDAFTTLPNVPIVGNYNLTVPVTNTSGSAATLHAWVDFNKNGKFEATEYKSAAVASGNTSANLSWIVPANAVVGSTHARFRLTTNDNLTTDNPLTIDVDERSSGNATNGEVEDYPVSISTIYDYGDAPDTGSGTGTGNYQTKASDGGAAQIKINTAGQVLSLGSNIDSDDGTLQNTAADADDTNGTPDDEDGVTSFPALTTAANQTYTVPVSVQNNVPTTNAYLVGYIDFNKDGDFLDAGEKSTTVTIPTSSTNPRTFNVTFTTPAGMTTGNTYARFRLGQVQTTVESATGASVSTDNGEIEDYQIAIAPALDYGDAPDTYGTDKTAGNSTNTSDPVGASHIITSNLFLGATVPDADTNGFVDGVDDNKNATDDDAPIGTGTGNGDDEDNFTLPTLTEGNTSYTIPASNIKATNTTTGAATLHAWIDFNKNGKFDPTEYASAAVNPGTNNGSPTANLTWSGISVGATGDTYARFRLTSDSSITSTTPGTAANSGEVEDYQIAIANGNRPLGSSFTCNSTFYITTGDGGISPQSLYDINRSGSTYTFTQRGPSTSNTNGYPNTFSYNALAYNPVDNYLYAFVTASSATTGPYAVGNVVKIGSDGILRSLGIPTNGSGGTLPITSYYAATMLADGTYVIGQASNFAKLNITTSPPTILSTGSLSGVNFTDFAVDPTDPTSLSGGKIYGINEGDGSNRLVILNVAGNNPTIVSQATNSTGFGDNAGSQFVDSFGTLYYRSGTNNSLYRVDSDPTSSNYGRATLITTTPTGANTDGASCLFSSAMQKEVQDLNGNTITTSPAGATVKYVYSIASGNVQNLTGITFQDDLRAVSSGNPINGTFTGTFTVSNGSGTVSLSNNNQTIQISNLVIPAQTQATAGADKLTITAEVKVAKTLTPGTYFNQSFVSNLPSTYPPSIPSDYPTSSAYEDPTPLQITAPVASDPKLLLVKRITAINAVQFNNFVDDPSTPNDNASNWPDSDGNPGNNINTYLRGATSVDKIKPGDEVEYTIYFLSNGDTEAKNVKLCDVVPDNMTFVANSYSTNFGVALALNATALPTTKNLSNAIGDDEGDFYPPNTNPTVTNLCKKHNATNNLIPLTNSNNLSGAVLIQLTTPLPNATGSGTPPNSYGFIRFRAKVK